MVPPNGQEQGDVPLSVQSSTAVMCRAVVMLACLVAIPLTAVLGTSLPQMFKSLIEGRLDACWASARGSLGEDQPLKEAQPFVSAIQSSPLPMTAGANTSTGCNADKPQPAPPTGEGHLAAASQAEAMPANYQVSVEPPAAGLHTASSSTMSASLIPVVPPDTVPPDTVPPDTVPPDTVPPDTNRTPLPGDRKIPPAGLSSSRPAAPTDRFIYIQKRLRHLGATYYLLESCGSECQLYRFYCRMAVGGNPNYNRYFEARDADALQAMVKVLAEVEAWQSDRR